MPLTLTTSNKLKDAVKIAAGRIATRFGDWVWTSQWIRNRLNFKMYAHMYACKKRLVEAHSLELIPMTYNHSEAKPHLELDTKSWISSYRNRALLVSGSNTAKQATLVALLDPSTHFRQPLTHTSHHRPALVDLSRLRVSPILTHSRFRLSSTCVSAVSGVPSVGVSLLSADVAVAVVRPEVISQRVFISRGRTRAHWKALVKAHTIVQ
jgi:hypothetical protein